MRTSLFALMNHIVSEDAKRKNILLLDTEFHLSAQNWSLLLRMFLKWRMRKDELRNELIKRNSQWAFAHWQMRLLFCFGGSGSRLGRKIKTDDKMGDMPEIIRHTTNDNQRNIIRLSFIIRVRARVFWGLGGSLSLRPYQFRKKDSTIAEARKGLLQYGMTEAGRWREDSSLRSE